MRRLLATFALWSLAACAKPGAMEPVGTAQRPLSVLGFTRALGFVHPSIVPATQALKDMGADAGWVVEVTEDPTVFTAERLQRTDVVVFLLTSGDVLDAPEEAAVEAFIRGGGGYVGVHSASDTEYGWGFYGELLGTYFDNHPVIQTATLNVEAGAHPAAQGLGATWTRTDEWYNFRVNPRPGAEVVLTIDETSYQGGTMGGDHPMAWGRAVGSGRAFYTELGHTEASYAEAEFLGHLRGAIFWASGR